MTRPRKVNIALTLLWLEVLFPFVIATLFVALNPEFAADPTVWYIFLFALVPVTAAFAFLIYLIGTKRKWARDLFLVFQIVSLISVVFWPDLEVPLALSEMVIYSVQALLLLMSVIALYWLYTGEGGQWFESHV